MGLSDDLEYARQLELANPNATNSLNTFNSNLGSVYSSLSKLNSVQTNALFRQNDVKDIIDNESTRLQTKKSQIDQAVDNQKRIIAFNDNSRKVYAAYLKIMVVATITLAIVWLIRVIDNQFGSFIPGFIMTILMIATVSIGLIIMYNYYVAIRSRDSYNFDELKLDPPDPLATPTPDPSLTGRMGSVGIACAGSYCCSPSTVWEPLLGQCITPQGTTGP